MKKITIIFLLLISANIVFSQQIEEKILIPALQENSKRYFYFPFDVPVNTKSVVVEYAYDKSANTLDLGVFDNNFDETEKTTSGFRGWSGGRRSQIFISENTATNGYLSGKIGQGKWRVIFGLYKIAPAGVEVTVKIKFNEVSPKLLAEPEQESATKYNLPTKQNLSPMIDSGGQKWFRGDLHIHTFHSDGNWTIPLVFEWAKLIGLDFIGLTEHNTMSHHAEINRIAPRYPKLLAMRGEEVTTYGGHFNVWSLPTGELIDFRVTPKNSAELAPKINRVRQLNLLASINHPTAVCGGCAWTYGDWSQMDSVEIWNGGWDLQDEAALKKWDEMLQTGKRIAALGSSDTHTPLPGESKTNPGLGSPCNYIAAKNLTQNEILAAIKRGKVWLAESPKTQFLEFTALADGNRLSLGDSGETGKAELNLKVENFPANSVVLLIANGQLVRREKINRDKFELSAAAEIEKDSYFRVEIRNPENKMLALTNPIFLRKKR
jgi:hypothetical protein